jgi:FAD/FMN-containing dehydrogenase
VRSGGHYAPAGYANIDNGVLISMSGFREITVHDGYARVGAGNLWGNVYAKLEQSGVAVGGAAVADVGVGGFLLGGMLCLNIVKELERLMDCRWNAVYYAATRLCLQ